MMYPEARRTNVLVKELEGEVVLYDELRHRAHRLNPTAALVWRHCNGRCTIAQLALLRPSETTPPIGEEVVRLALTELAHADLLSGEGQGEGTLSRRAALRRAASMTGLILLPAVTTIAAPTPADAQSSRGRKRGEGSQGNGPNGGGQGQGNGPAGGGQGKGKGPPNPLPNRR